MKFYSIIFVLLCLISCKSKKANLLFTARSATETGLQFENRLQPTEQFNLLSYMYFYNGAGTGAADFNNDGKIDLFFAANQKPSSLFLNKGQLKFENVSNQAQLPKDSSWSTGVSVVDINNDGWMDVYICKVGKYKNLKSKNQLLINQGIDKDNIPHFKEDAASYGLDFSGFSTQAAFFDYDGDSDLDMFLLNHSVNHDGNYAPRAQFENTYDSLAGQRLYKNVGKRIGGQQQAYFTNLTKEAGIRGTKINYGLGVVISDVNVDGWPDIYVGNDFHENDYLYINQKNGTFTEESTKQFTHTSQFSMGVDAGDANNDGLPDIVSMDMLPYDPYMIRRSLAEDDFTIYNEKIKYGYSYQYARNNLQKNNGDGTFTELGQYAGIYASDWSWATLFVDFDNDGLKDLFISNGIPKRMNDIDYINFVTNNTSQQLMNKDGAAALAKNLNDKFPEIKLPNQFYMNKGNFSFVNAKDSVANNPNTFSNSAVVADFDNDGDQDIVVNNIDDAALLYENNSAKKKKQDWLNVTLIGDSLNKQAIGAKLIVYTNKCMQVVEQSPVRGFLGSMQAPLHVGLGNQTIDSAFIIWPNGKKQILDTNATDITCIYNQQAKVTTHSYVKAEPQFTLEDITASTGIQVKHLENDFNEFNREQLLPRMNSTEGPAIAVGDVNGDGMDDLFVGNAKGYSSKFFLQQANGRFEQAQQQAMQQDSMWETVDAAIVDVNADGAKDIVVATAGNEYYGEDSHLMPLLYLNDGKGNFTKSAEAFGQLYATQSCVRPFDFDGDGAIDLFIGAKVKPWEYGTAPNNYLLHNNGKGKFEDVTQKWLGQPFLAMLSDAQWIDWDTDGKTDLVFATEWGGIDYLQNKGNKFERRNIVAQKGWWATIAPFQQNNKWALMLGNMGMNTKLQPSQQEPVQLYVNDYDGNGRKEQVLTYFYNHKEIPFASKQTLEKQTPFLKKKYLLAADFAQTSIADLYGKDKIDAASKLTTDYFWSSSFSIDGGLNALPWQLQLSQIKCFQAFDANGDAYIDFIAAGNFYNNSIDIGRQDACKGAVLLGKGNGQFECIEMAQQLLNGEVRKIKPIVIKGNICYVVARSGGMLQVVKRR